ncbi:unnamed protein product [Adineta steineri]|uniref:Toll-interacting protein n=1 Tax=Adineta steineri TaxID=433720 RepID=A0A813Z083_9BILA|nr:unnamed protein product [Adineta steineri]CAF3724251.1 unnamed protein product [Adineta steineri]
MASAVVSSGFTPSSIDNSKPKFSNYQSRVMLGDLPSDFLRVQLVEPQIYDSSNAQLEHHQNPNFLGFFTLTFAEAKLIKNSGPLGLLRMDPYVRFQLGHVSYETPTATGGGKNPQWKVSYRINLFKGMDKIHLELFDQRSFTEDNFIGECDIEIPREVLDGQTHQHWYPLMGREANINENQGDILIVMSFISTTTEYSSTLENPSFSNSPTMSSLSSQSNSITESTLLYTVDDIKTIEEMFPTIDRQIIIDLLEKYGGNKDIVVNHLLQNSV